MPINLAGLLEKLDQQGPLIGAFAHVDTENQQRRPKQVGFDLDILAKTEQQQRHANAHGQATSWVLHSVDSGEQQCRGERNQKGEKTDQTFHESSPYHV